MSRNGRGRLRHRLCCGMFLTMRARQMRQPFGSLRSRGSETSFAGRFMSAPPFAERRRQTSEEATQKKQCRAYHRQLRDETASTLPATPKRDSGDRSIRRNCVRRATCDYDDKMRVATHTQQRHKMNIRAYIRRNAVALSIDSQHRLRHRRTRPREMRKINIFSTSLCRWQA